mgnify:CR=1 FL=1
MKEHFINSCKASDLIEMNGIIIQYLESCNSLSYRVLGETTYISLDDIEDKCFSRDDEWLIIDRFNARYKFKFYTEKAV